MSYIIIGKESVVQYSIYSIHGQFGRGSQVLILDIDPLPLSIEG